MGQGTLIINTKMADGTRPVPNVNFLIRDTQGTILFNGSTNRDGDSSVIPLSAPNAALTLTPHPNVLPYSVYDLWLAKPGFATVNIADVEIFDGQQAIMSVNMIPVTRGTENVDFEIPPPTAEMPTTSTGQPNIGDAISMLTDNPVNTMKFGREQRRTLTVPIATNNTKDTPVYIQRTDFVEDTVDSERDRILPTVVMPDYIVVHLGTPANVNAPNVRVRFIDYIKNVTCSEIYPTWPRNAIIANVHCIVTFALNRIYTQWYRIRGYNYDITNSTATDQFFVPNREIFSNISQIVDEIFDLYVRRQGFNNPYFTEYCNGTTATCQGLSQWGTVELANEGLSPLQILHHYYPHDLEVVVAPSGTVEGFPGNMLYGSSGDAVRRLQLYLNRIAANYPLIPQMPIVDGYFGQGTKDAVTAFQDIFNLTPDGVVGRSTWNRISQVYSAITKLSELESEGERIGLSSTPPTSTVSQGDRGRDVIHLQFLLDFIATYYNDIVPPVQDSVFGSSTTDAVRAFQQRFDLDPDGVVGPQTWIRLYQIYRDLQGQDSTPPAPPTTPPQQPSSPDFPGYILRQGQQGENVRSLQNLLNNSRREYAAVPQLTPDGIFGVQTNNAVRVFQRYAGLVEDGLVGRLTWEALTNI